MQENTTPEGPVVQEPPKAARSDNLGWFLGGAVLPLGSLSYYRQASQKSVGSAILFFFIFTIAIAVLFTISIAVGMYSARDGIQSAYENGEVPEITISHGIAEVTGEQPFILIDGEDANGQTLLVAADTTGKIRGIDEDRYDQGILLTRTQLHMLTNRNGYQVIPLFELNSGFDKDPILLNGETVLQLWDIISISIVLLSFIFLVLWHSVLRLMVIATLALILWGIVSLMRPKTEFGPIIITGLYAIVPAIYIARLFSRSGVGLPGVQTLFLISFWVIGLIAAFMDVGKNENRPSRLWTAWIGLPMLVLFVVDIFRPLPTPGGLIALWSVTLLTALTVVGLRLHFRYKDGRPIDTPPEPPAQA